MFFNAVATTKAVLLFRLVVIKLMFDFFENTTCIQATVWANVFAASCTNLTCFVCNPKLQKREQAVKARAWKGHEEPLKTWLENYVIFYENPWNVAYCLWPLVDSDLFCWIWWSRTWLRRSAPTGNGKSCNAGYCLSPTPRATVCGCCEVDWKCWMIYISNTYKKFHVYRDETISYVCLGLRFLLATFIKTHVLTLSFGLLGCVRRMFPFS